MIGILGGGLAGLSAAFRLESAGKGDFRLLEKGSRPGGLSQSWTSKGYTFDLGPHIIYTRDERAMGLIRKLLRGNLAKKVRENYIQLYGALIRYPFETFLHGLPPRVILECLEGALEARSSPPPPESANFKQWALATFGEGIARHYFIPYNLKVWKYPLERMGVDWIRGRVPSPDLRDMLRGALGLQDRDFGPNAVFHYPIRGGIGVLPDALARRVSGLMLGCEVRRVRPTAGGVRVEVLQDGKQGELTFSRVISTLALPDLVELIEEAPPEVRRAARSLVFNSLLCAGIGVRRKALSDKHSIYYPDRKLLFNRISFPANLARSCAPPGRSSILAEVTCPMGRRPDIGRARERVLSDLVKAGVLRESDAVECAELRTYPHAYVIHDLDHRRNVEEVHRYLRGAGIVPAGRFGEWEYLNMDRSMLSGMRAADEVLSG